MRPNEYLSFRTSNLIPERGRLQQQVTTFVIVHVNVRQNRKHKHQDKSRSKEKENKSKVMQQL